MDVEQLYNMLKKTQQARGYYFNEDRHRVFELLRALTTNKER
jgi:ferredoxin-thioredoxin reductase catalytic subunit